MPANNDLSQQLSNHVTNAFNQKTPLQISGGNSKAFYGRSVDAETISVAGHTGILSYEPSELVLTARSGTLISEIENELASNKQMLAFEPPCHSDKTTLGGSIACGLSGPARPFAGAARDFVLGTKVINGKGEVLRFGGEVMKNVAGYDVSRLMVGAQGTLGLLLEVSLKVLPMAEAQITLALETDFETAQANLRHWIQQGHPLSASCYYQNQLFIRLSSTANSVKQTHKLIGGEVFDDELWNQLRHQNHTFFKNKNNLWRVSVPADSPAIEPEQDPLIEWNGALRWVTSDNDLHTTAKQLSGHASRYAINTQIPETVFQPLTPTMLALHRRIKNAMDPAHILNPGRLYSEL